MAVFTSAQTFLDADSVWDNKGDIAFANANDCADVLSIGASNQILHVSACGIPEWSSDITVKGNLTVEGTTTTIESTVTTIADPLVIYSQGTTGTPTKDSGFIVERGCSANVGFLWDESADEFAVVGCTSETGTTAGNVTISGYGNLRANIGYMQGGLHTSGCIVLTNAATTVNLIDNNANALTFSTCGKAGIVKMVTTDCGEGVTMSGTLAVSGGCLNLSGAATDIDVVDNNACAVSFDASGQAGILAIDSQNCSEKVKMSAALTVAGTVTVGTDGSGSDVVFYSATAGDNLTWDASEELLTITGTNGQTALNVADGNLVVADTLDLNGIMDHNGTAFSTCVSGNIEIKTVNDAQNAVWIQTNGGTCETIFIKSGQGTSVTEGSASIELLSAVGGVELRSNADLANSIQLTADGGTTTSMLLLNDTGTGATEGSASLQITSDVGGINLKSGLNGAGALRLTADGGANETIIIHADQGTGADSINIMSDAGGITLAVADGKSILLHGSTVFNDEVTITYNATDTVVDTTKGNKFDLTFGTGNITDLYLHPTDGPANIVLRLVQDGTGCRVVTNWFKNGGTVCSPSGTTKVHFAGGTKPTLSTAAGAVDLFAFYYDGSNWHGTTSLDTKAYC
jgi:hypothetical protein